MYKQFYGFKERPFSLLPDPDFLFLSEQHIAALDVMELTVLNRAALCVVSGEIGVGKTTLIRELLNRLDDNINVGLVTSPLSSFGDLIQWLLAAYNQPCQSKDRLERHNQFIDYILQEYAKNRHTLLIIDEAQQLSVSALEQLRRLSNINTEKDLVLQIILVGQRELRDNLRQPQLKQFAQRISADYHLKGLNAQETQIYIEHRCEHSGGVANTFTKAACNDIYQFTSGVPRLINRVCDLCLLYGYADRVRQINAGIVSSVIADQHETGFLHAFEDMPDSQNAIESATTLAAKLTPPERVEPEISNPETDVLDETESISRTSSLDENQNIEATEFEPIDVDSDLLPGSRDGEQMEAPKLRLGLKILHEKLAIGSTENSDEASPGSSPQFTDLSRIERRRSLWLMPGVIAIVIGSVWLAIDSWDTTPKFLYAKNSQRDAQPLDPDNPDLEFNTNTLSEAAETTSSLADYSEDEIAKEDIHILREAIRFAVDRSEHKNKENSRNMQMQQVGDKELDSRQSAVKKAVKLPAKSTGLAKSKLLRPKYSGELLNGAPEGNSSYRREIVQESLAKVAPEIPHVPQAKLPEITQQQRIFQKVLPVSNHSVAKPAYLKSVAERRASVSAALKREAARKKAELVLGTAREEIEWSEPE